MAWNRSYSNVGLACKECKQRYPGCHDKCDTYKSAVAERKEKLDKAKQQKSVESEWLGFYSTKRGRAEW